LKVWDGIDKYCIVPVRKLFYFHHWFVLYGLRICHKTFKISKNGIQFTKKYTFTTYLNSGGVNQRKIP